MHFSDCDGSDEDLSEMRGRKHEVAKLPAWRGNAQEYSEARQCKQPDTACGLMLGGPRLPCKVSVVGMAPLSGDLGIAGCAALSPTRPSPAAAALSAVATQDPPCLPRPQLVDTSLLTFRVVPTSVAMPQPEPPVSPDKEFEHTWLHDDGVQTSTICGRTLITGDRPPVDLEVKAVNAFSVRLGSRTLHARAVGDKLVWSDGRVWTRVADGIRCKISRNGVDAQDLDTVMPGGSRPRPKPVVQPLPAVSAVASPDCQPPPLVTANPASRQPRSPTALTDDVDQLFLEVAPDDGGRPLRPPPAKSTQGNMLAAGDEGDDMAPMAEQAMREEEQWLERKRLTGAVGKLVRYKEGQHPLNDILGLRLTKHGRITVTALQQDGPASRAGVSAGDQLASIDGRPPVAHGPANTLLETVRAPVALVFLGFAGKLQAEVRVRQPGQPRCGIPEASEIVGNAAGREVPPVKLTEAVVFGPPDNSIFIATLPMRDKRARDVQRKYASRRNLEGSFNNTEEQSPCSTPRSLQKSHSNFDGTEETSQDGASTGAGELGLYELQREEARRLLKRAMRYTPTPTGLRTV